MVLSGEAMDNGDETVNISSTTPHETFFSLTAKRKT
jgi:hypothetical protein